MSIRGSKSYSNQQSESKQNIWGDQSPYLQDLYGHAQNLFNNPNQDTQMGSDMQRAYAGSNELGETIGNTQNALNFALNPQNSMNNPYLQQSMNNAIRPITQNFQENVMSGITDQAVSSGQSGSSRQGIAEGIAARGYMDQVGDVTSQMQYQNYNDGMNRMSNAINQAGSVANLGMMPSSIYQSMGNQDWDRLNQYRNTIGAPTVLGNSKSSGGSKSWSYGAGLT